jgi:uncharacterized membrane protein YgcG
MRYANWIVATAAGISMSLASGSFAQVRIENKRQDPDFPLSKAFGKAPEADASKSQDDDGEARAQNSPAASERPRQEERRQTRRPPGDDGGTPKESSLMLRSSQISGMPLRSENGQPIGKLVDVVGNASGQSQFAVVSLKGNDRMIVLPYSGLRFQAGRQGDNYASLRIATSQLKNAPSFVGDEWPTFTSKYSGWVTEFYSDLAPISGTANQGSRTPSSIRNHDQAEPALSEASSSYPNPTPPSVDGAPRTAAGATPSGVPLPGTSTRPSTMRPGAAIPGIENRNQGDPTSPRLPGSAVPGAPGNTSGAPAPGGSGPGGSVPGGTGGASGGTGAGGAAGGTSSSGGGGSSSSGS